MQNVLQCSLNQRVIGAIVCGPLQNENYGSYHPKVYKLSYVIVPNVQSSLYIPPFSTLFKACSDFHVVTSPLYKT